MLDLLMELVYKNNNPRQPGGDYCFLLVSYLFDISLSALAKRPVAMLLPFSPT